MLTIQEYRAIVYRGWLLLDSADWEESEHPRDKRGRFRSGNGNISVMGEIRQASIEEIAGFLAGNATHPIAVAAVPIDIQSALGASAVHVLLSRYTADKQKKHPEITAESFRFLQELLDTGERLYDKKHHATVIQHREQPYVAVLKATKSGEEVYLQSFRRTDAKNIASLRKRSAGGG
jgi:hypothetical protein